MKLKQLTKSNIKGFLQGYWRALKLFLGLDIEYRKEVFFYRIGMMDLDCVKNKECPCSCVIVYKQLEDRACENKCYEDMMSKEEWAEYREKIIVKDKIKLGKERIKLFNIDIPSTILKTLNNG